MSRDEVLAVLLETFRRDGYDGASLALLSEATGLGKSSLYHYFPGGKEDMVNQVLDRVDDWMRAELVTPLAGDGPIAARVDRMIATLNGFYANGTKACILGRLCASVNREQFQPRLQRLFGAWIDALTALRIEGGDDPASARNRAEDAVIRVQGALVLCDGLGDPAPFRRAMEQLRTELRGHG
jgi:TetR/AcrR family transcriptional repressor of lmrAB and yxaGH operons